jgi:hypothetical protein
MKITKKHIIIGIVVLVLAASAIANIVDPNPKQPASSSPPLPEPPKLEEWQTKNNRLMAYVMMQEYVKKNLKAPATAKFGSTVDYGVSVTQGENYVYLVDSYVDSQNTFGANIRTYFSGTIQQISKDEWLPLSLEFQE